MTEITKRTTLAEQPYFSLVWNTPTLASCLVSSLRSGRTAEATLSPGSIWNFKLTKLNVEYSNMSAVCVKCQVNPIRYLE
jgi:hypothetical protein